MNGVEIKEIYFIYISKKRTDILLNKKLFWIIFMRKLLIELKISFKNVLRNSRRTVLTLFSIVFGTVFIMIFTGYVNGVSTAYKERQINSNLGHFQIYKSGYLNHKQDYSLKYSFSPDEAYQIQEILEDEVGGIEFVVPRINITGFLRTDSGDFAPFKGYSGDVEYEMLMGFEMREGEGLNIIDYNNVLVGTELLNKLKANVGQSVEMLFMDEQDTELEPIEVVLNGTADFSADTGITDANSTFTVTSIDLAQEVLNTDKVQYIVVMLNQSDKIYNAIDKFKKIAEQQGLSVEVRTWDELSEIYKDVVLMYRSVIFISLAVILIIVILSIINSMFMSVLERVSEIGTMRAIGSSKSKVIRLIFFESVFIGLIGIAVSIIFTSLSVITINSLDFSLPPPPGYSEPIPFLVFMNFRIYATYSAITLITCIVASILPALKASSINIINAIGHH